MKRILTILAVPFGIFAAAFPVLATDGQSPMEIAHSNMGRALIVLALMLAILIVCCVLFTRYNMHCRKRKFRIDQRLVNAMYLTTLILFACTVIGLIRYFTFL